MAIPVCLALTAAELAFCRKLPDLIGYLACHFSPTGPGLSNMPPSLPLGSVLLVDDSNPFDQHCPEQILTELSAAVDKMGLRAVLLDFQRKDNPDVKKLAEILQTLPCPVIVTQEYALERTPILLPPCPVNRELEVHLAPYKGREIWLEVALESMNIHIDKTGCHKDSMPYDRTVCLPHRDEKLRCHYSITQGSDTVTFHLQQDQGDIQSLLNTAEQLGVVCAIGLWQELG